jgi:hypothetical protein
MTSKITAVLLISGVLTLSLWLYLSAPFFTAYAFVTYPPDYTGGGYGSGMYLLKYPAILLCPLVIGIALMTLGVARWAWQIK